ncbi:MAG: hypothetical protein FWD99_00005, partial [Oscillospiraceae bacterium]|nr:hypothetical protein [Oscillospiraceae bacterium]
AVVYAGWLRGDGAGLLRPTDDIQRSEAAAVIARALGRDGVIDTASLVDVADDVRLFTDVRAGQWYYFLAIEVSHSHYFVTENRNVGTAVAPIYREMELWTEITWPSR